MTNKEKYKQAFSVLHTSNDFTLEVKTMKHTNHNRIIRSIATAAAAFVIVLASATTAYAMDLGGIQRKVQLWIHGNQTQVTIEFDGKGNYTMDYLDEEGNVQSQSGGGVAIDSSGNERPLTEDELMNGMGGPEVVYKEDGSVWVYWYDQKIDITDKFEDNICYVKLVNEKETLYLTIKYQNGYSCSPFAFKDPADFN